MILLVCLALPTWANAQSAPTTEAPTEDEVTAAESSSEKFDLTANLASFDQVWSLIDTSHWDEDVVGQAWDDAKAKYRPQVESAESIDEVRKIVGEMIDELGLSHFGIIAASSYEIVGDENKGGEGDAGIEFRAIEDAIIVSEVRPESAAAKAGVKPGWQLEAIGEKSVADLTKKIRAAAHGPIRYETLAGLALSRMSAGSVDSTKSFVFRDENDQTRELDLKLEPSPGSMTQFGHLPPMKVHTVSKTLAGNVGYYRFNAFLDPVRVMPEFRQAVHADEHNRGMIIDLRGNIGGLGGMTMGMASEFSNHQTSLGIMTMKGSKLKFFVNANLDPVSVPTAVLIDECSISSAEIFSGGLQDLKLARLFGQRSAGLALPSVVVKLPNGDGFQYAMANYQSASGRTLEKDGVTPDEEIPLTRASLLADPDPVLSRAVQWIASENEKTE